MRLRIGLVLAAAAVVFAVAAWTIGSAAPQRWSDPATWGGALPSRDGVVTIARGKTVLLDVQPPRLRELVVNGRLIVADRDVSIEAQNIVVHGTLDAGSSRHPFAHRLQFVLDRGPRHGGTLTVTDGGCVNLWGVPRTSWTRLAATAAPGATTLQLESAPNWSRGDEIAIAPSGFDALETEQAAIASVRGSQVLLTAPLRYRHWGTSTDGVDERAEVGSLTRSILVRSRDENDRIGGQVLVLAGGVLHASGVEFRGLGELGEKGRYPVHFHLVGEGRGSFVQDSSVVRSHNRCIVVHGTNDVIVRDNVAYDAVGHCYFFEDGIERGIVLEHNLGLLTRAASAAHAILDSDVLPATFWITNPANTVAGNVAAGSQGNGFWYNLSPHPTGPSATTSIWPRRTALGEFSGNVAHSNENDGLFVDILRNPPGVREAPNYDPPVPAYFTKFLSYKNRRRGVWLRGEQLYLTDSVIADNSIGVTFAGAADELSDSLVVGETGNDTGPPKPFDARFPIRGFEFYDGRVGVRDTKFRNFVPNAQRQASALSTLEFSPFFTDPTNYAQGLTFENAQRVFFAPHPGARDKLGADGYRSTVFQDLDGSVTGTPGTSVTYVSPFLADPGCALRRTWNARVCDSPYASVFFVVPGANAQPLRIARRSGYAYLTLYGNPDRGTNVTFQTNVRAGGAYDVTLPSNTAGPVRIAAHHLPSGAMVTLYIRGRAGSKAERMLVLRPNQPVTVSPD